MRASVIFALSLSFAVGLTLQLLSCILYHNWWPLLTGVMYVLAPMPVLFLSAGDASGVAGSYSSLGGDSWDDLAKFLVGFSAVGTVGIPVVLTHAHLISGAQLALALPSAVLLAATAVAYGLLSRGGDDSGYGYVYGY